VEGYLDYLQPRDFKQYIGSRNYSIVPMQKDVGSSKPRSRGMGSPKPRSMVSLRHYPRKNCVPQRNHKARHLVFCINIVAVNGETNPCCMSRTRPPAQLPNNTAQFGLRYHGSELITFMLTPIATGPLAPLHAALSRITLYSSREHQWHGYPADSRSLPPPSWKQNTLHSTTLSKKLSGPAH
jgi:hypothetical protein